MNKLLTNILIAFAICALILLPDITLSQLGFMPHRQIASLYSMLPYALLALTMALCAYGLGAIALCILLLFLHLQNALHIGYFGADLTPDTLSTFWNNAMENTSEVASSLNTGSIGSFMIIASVTISSYIAVLWLIWRTRSSRYNARILSWMLCIFLLATPTIRALNQKVYLCYPNPLRLSLYNNVNSTGVFLSRLIRSAPQANWQNYSVSFTNPAADNVILVMGESTRYDYMSVYGFPHKTTPFLESEKAGGNAAFTKAASAGVSTNVSLVSFFNLLREPGNIGALNSQEANLFRIAKHQGYKTILISAQSASLFYGIGTQYIDHFIAREQMEEGAFLAMRDEILAAKLSSVLENHAPDSKLFIVLHMRSMHSPFKDNYSHKTSIDLPCPIASDADRATQERSDYCNAMRFNDHVLEGILHFSKKRFNRGRNYLFFTSDHGELLGEGGLFGHNHLNLECAMVPFIIWNLGQKHDPLLAEVSQYDSTSHYDIGILIANLLGATVTNPNDNGERQRFVFSQTFIINPHITYYLPNK